MQYLRILFGNFVEEDFQRFCIKFNYVQIVFGYYFAENVVAPPFEQTFLDIPKDNLCAIYLRILFSSFEEENFQRFALN